MNKSVLILTEATSRSGLGHYTRCCALAQILANLHVRITLAIVTDEMLLPVMEDKFTITKTDWHVRSEFDQLFESSGNGTIIIDSYMTTNEEYDYFAGITEKLVCIDDYSRILYPKTATIINPGFGGGYVDYQAQGASIKTGPDFVLLRSPFRESFRIQPVKKQIESILITVGSEDRWDIVPALLSFLAQNYAHQQKHVMVGPGFKNQREILASADSHTRIHENLIALEIRNLMLECDVAITAGGQTTNELVKCGAPMIVLKIADNQLGNIQNLLSAKLIPSYCETPENAIPFVATELLRLAHATERGGARLPSSDSFGTGIGYAQLFQ